jgi:peptidoglycan/LPS O-acetylase OafA/YrhL
LFYTVLIWKLLFFGWQKWNVLLANLTFTFNLIPGMEQSLVWAGRPVSVEMIFYVVLPILLRLCTDWKRTAIVWMTALAVSISLWSICLAIPELPKNYAYFFVGSNNKRAVTIQKGLDKSHDIC